MFAKGHIMNNPVAAIVLMYALVVRRTVYEAGISFADFTMLKHVLLYTCRCMCCHT